MDQPQASVAYPISVEVGGAMYQGRVVITGTQKLQFVVQYAGKEQGDVRDWGTDTEGRRWREIHAAMPLSLGVAGRQSAMRLPWSSQWASTFLLGCTRGGSPGIFG